MLGQTSSRMLLLIGIVAFVSLGLPDGVLGVAWPSIRRSFTLPLSELGVLLGASTLGYLASSFSSGPVAARLGIGRLLLWSSILMVISSLGYATAPAWPVMLLGGLLAGLGAGAIDAGINAFAAAHVPARLVNWLHASYGVGAMLGPLLMTGVLTAGLSWRWGYAAIGALLAAMTLCFAATLGLWDVERGRAHTPAGATGDADACRSGRAGFAATLRRPRLWMNVTLFFVYTGLEVTAGQWMYSLLTEGRGISPATAGLWVAVYWGSLTLGRVVFGALTLRFSSTALLRTGLIGAPLAAAVIWFDPVLLGFLGLAPLGFSLAPIYPLLISATPQRLGPEHADHAIGFQVAAAYLGSAALPGAAGMLARAHGLEIIGPFLLAAAGALLALHEVVLRQTRGVSIKNSTLASRVYR
jgi:fucose permease